MAYFLNVNFKNNEFELVTKDKYFIDKTQIIEKMNELIGIKDQFVCKNWRYLAYIRNGYVPYCI